MLPRRAGGTRPLAALGLDSYLGPGAGNGDTEFWNNSTHHYHAYSTLWELDPKNFRANSALVEEEQLMSASCLCKRASM